MGGAISAALDALGITDAGKNVRAEYEQNKFNDSPQRRKERAQARGFATWEEFEAAKNRKAMQGPNLTAEDVLANQKAFEDQLNADANTVQANKHLAGIERYAKVIAENSENVFGTSQLGGDKINAVNLGRVNGSTRAAQVDQMFGLVQMAAVASQTSMIRRR